MSNISGLGPNLIDLEVLKKAKNQQNVNAETNNGVTNVFDEGLGVNNKNSENSNIFDDISELTEEDIKMLEEEELSEKEEVEEKSVFATIFSGIDYIKAGKDLFKGDLK